MKYDKNQIDPSDAMEAIGIDFTDEFDKPIEFDDSPEGIKQNVGFVIKAQQKEIAETRIIQLFY